MYSTCLFCHAALGANEVVEPFPIGRRLAFDAAKGRLWVICRTCGRWNLTPLEERWEAIEECERRFRDARLRVSTDQIGLARLREGLELVRVGDPHRPEMAAWRYGRTFFRRRMRNLPAMRIASYGAMGLAWAGFVGVVSPLVAGGGYALGFGAMMTVMLRQSRARVGLDDGRVLRLGPGDVYAATLGLEGAEPWTLSIGKVTLSRDEGRRAVGTLLTRVNRYYGRRQEVDRALAYLERAGGPDALLERLARAYAPAKTLQLNMLHSEVALALEMAAHEEAERRAMEGELAALAHEWELAERIAAIADRLLARPDVEGRLKSMQEGRRP